jgi:hypothetical protein
LPPFACDDCTFRRVGDALFESETKVSAMKTADVRERNEIGVADARADADRQRGPAIAARLMRLSFRCTPGEGDMSDRKKLMALRDASVDARRKAALGLDMGDPTPLETLTRTHILIMALDAVIDELLPDADVDRDPAL